jgi:hypothetical protein
MTKLNTDKYTSELPKFEHDCDCCVFLGNFQGQDLYWCAGEPVARRSSRPEDYSSGHEFASVRPALAEAVRRATGRKV